MISNLDSNTGERFISKKRTCFAVTVPLPDDTKAHRSVGFVRLGEKKALIKTKKLRNAIGKFYWGKDWDRILNDKYLFTRLPHSLEPMKKISECGVTFYEARKTKFNKNGEVIGWEQRTFSATKYGGLGAYNMAKRELCLMHKDVIGILSTQKRFTVITHI